ncbi:MAG: hypothetical protein OXE86_08755 [Alphaproteobacteria bacterium]|nr:hypothetical protein [Alphaproteobacteria bacterium]
MQTDSAMTPASARRDSGPVGRSDFILPGFGHMTVDSIAVEHVKDWFASTAERPGSANRPMLVLSTGMRAAELWGYRRHNSNPCKNAK